LCGLQQCPRVVDAQEFLIESGTKRKITLFVANIPTFVVSIRLRNDLYCVGWGVKLYSLTHSWLVYSPRVFLSVCVRAYFLYSQCFSYLPVCNCVCVGSSGFCEHYAPEHKHNTAFVWSNGKQAKTEN